MGLSRNTENKGDISVFQLLLELAQGIQKLTSDPKALEKAAKDAYALSDNEEKKAIEARSLISEYVLLLEKNAEQKEELDAQLKQIKQETIKQEQIRQLCQKEALDLEAKKSVDAERELIIKRREESVKQLENNIALEKQELIHEWEKLNNYKKQVDDYEASLKEKANKLKGLIAGV